MPSQENGRSPQRIAVTAWFVGALTFVALRFVVFLVTPVILGGNVAGAVIFFLVPIGAVFASSCVVPKVTLSRMSVSFVCLLPAPIFCCALLALTLPDYVPNRSSIAFELLTVGILSSVFGVVLSRFLRRLF